MSGWIKLHRKLLDWEWYSKPVVKSVFIHSLLRANHKDGKWRGKDVKRGSYISSVDKLIDDLGHTRQEIRTALKHLKSTNELTTKSSAQHTVFTVVNYENYQDTTNELTNEQPTANQQSTTNKNDKNDKNEKKEDIVDTDSGLVLSYLNKITGSKYKLTTTSHIQNINARLNDYTVKDLKDVIDCKNKEWANDPKMAAYLRPQTLFSAGKFDGYLKATKATGLKKDINAIGTNFNEKPKGW
jgi:uncharacterized phage protein (TIGR02220 family)